VAAPQHNQDMTLDTGFVPIVAAALEIEYKIAVLYELDWQILKACR
jgi:hypothetical protein